MREADDAILDACLDEVLGGAQPPDLSGRILAALALNSATSVEASQSPLESPARARMTPIPVRAASPATEPAVVTERAAPALSIAGNRTSSADRVGAARLYRSTGLRYAAAAALFLMVGWYGLFGQGFSRQAGPAADQVANTAAGNGAPSNAAQTAGGHRTLAQDRQSATAGQIAGKNAAAAKRVTTSPAESTTEPGAAPSDGTPSVESGLANAATHDAADRVADAPAVDHPESPDTAADPAVGIASASDATAPRQGLPAQGLPAQGLPTTSAASSGADVVAFVDGSLRRQWQELGLRPSPSATDAEWCRRVYLDLVGRIPSTQELESFLLDRARDKRVRLVDLLLSEDYVEEFARHWTTYWTNTLIGRSGGQQPDSLVNRAGLQQYLRRGFLHNKPYDQLVYELLSASGSNRPGDEDFNGAVNFLLDNLQENAATATAKTGQVFLGVQIQCTQCHNHPFNEWNQSQFWEMNAFFRQTRDKPETQGAELVAVRLTDEDYAGAQGDTPHEAEIYYELRNGTMQVAWPRFVDGTAINPSGLVNEVNRRDELARLVVGSEYLGKAIVNRLWGHFFGYGFTKPVDDMGPHNMPSHPELLDRLATEFVAHGHDLKELMRWIALSEAYGLSSKFGPQQGNAADDPTTGAAPQFSHFYLRQMTAEQLYDSLLVATEAEQSAGGYEEREAIKRQWLDQFTLAFGTDDNGEATTFDGTIAQALMMMNGELTRQATSGQAGGFLQKVTARVGQEPAQINHLYLAALARKPSRQELQLANGLLASRQGNSATVLEDVWWALLNSNEFILNH